MTIRIQNLEFDAIIGILDFERDRAQKVRLNITIDYDYSPPDYLDYAKVVELSKNHIIEKKYELLEEALEGLQEVLARSFPDIDKLNITISKPNILPDCVVSISS